MTGFTYNQNRGTAITSTEYSTNGDKCVKLNRITSDPSLYYMFQVEIDCSNLQGKTLKFICDILNSSSEVMSIQMRTDTSNFTYVNISPGDSMESYYLSYEIPSYASLLSNNK